MTSSGVPVWGVLGQQGASTALTDEQLESFGPRTLGYWFVVVVAQGTIP